MTEHDLGDLLTRAKNSLDHDLSSLSAFTSIAGGISDLPPESAIPKAELFFSFGFGTVIEDGKYREHPVIEEVRRDFAEHSGRYAVLAMVTAFEVYMERILWIAMLISHARDRSARITTEKMRELRIRASKKAQGNNPVLMIDEVRKELATKEKVDSINWVQSIYKARKVLSHRGGIVSEADIDDDGKFKLQWRTISIGENESGEAVLRFIETSRNVVLGESLDFSPADCQDLAFSLASCADELTNLIVNVSREILAEEQPPRKKGG